jgi:hypothetical protein
MSAIRSLESSFPPPPKRLGGTPRVPLRWEEALDIQADLLGDLPLPPRLEIRIDAMPEPIVLALDGSSSDGLALDASEWRAIARAAAADRVWPADFASLCHRKRTEPAWRIEEDTALAGAQIDRDARWTAREVLDRIGAEVVAIELAA